MHVLQLDNAKFTALAAVILLMVVGCYAQQQTIEVPPAIDPPEVNIARLQPPIIVRISPDAEWDQPQIILPPKIAIDLSIEAPQLAPMPLADITEQTQLDLAQSQAETYDVETEDQQTSTGITTAQTPGSQTLQTASYPVANFNDAQFEPGSLIQTTWTAGEALHGAQIPTPVLVATGKTAGPTLCVTAAVHGDELNGIEAVRQLMYSLNPDKLTGTVIGVPIVNLQGFQRHSRYLSDRRDLNRFFPGNSRGSSASRMAHGFFNEIIQRCNGLVDLHTGSFHRTNLPQLRADLNNADVLALTKGFGATVILHSTGGSGTLRRAAVDAGIPAVTLEAGEPLRLQEDAVDHTVKALFTLLDTLHMYNKRSLWGNPEPTYYSSSWVRADQGGLLLSSVKLGRKVKQGDRLGTVTDPISNEQVAILAPSNGRVIGMALNQFVMPGFATFHLATEGAINGLEDDPHYHAEGMDVAATESLSADESE